MSSCFCKRQRKCKICKNYCLPINNSGYCSNCFVDKKCRYCNEPKTTFFFCEQCTENETFRSEHNFRMTFEKQEKENNEKLYQTYFNKKI